MSNSAFKWLFTRTTNRNDTINRQRFLIRFSRLGAMVYTLELWARVEAKIGGSFIEVTKKKKVCDLPFNAMSACFELGRFGFWVLLATLMIVQMQQDVAWVRFLAKGFPSCR
jgi:hypothetical protein